jgi:hypothetical protein
MSWKALLALTVPLVICAGCIQSHSAPPTVYVVPSTTTVLQPTSDRPAPRVYPGPSTPEFGSTPPSAPPPGVSQVDLAVAQQVSQALKTDPLLESISDNVQATVHKGIVTLRGSVPSEHARDQLTERLSKLPGVDRLDNDVDVNIH